jgi:hypothetical protein
MSYEYPHPNVSLVKAIQMNKPNSFPGNRVPAISNEPMISIVLVNELLEVKST